MFKKIMLCAALFSMLAPGAVFAQSAEVPVDPSSASVASDISAAAKQDRVRLANLQAHVFDALQHPPGLEGPGEELLQTIVQWLSENFPLPENHEYPAIRFTKPLELFKIRYKAFLSDKAGEDIAPDSALFAAHSRRVVAIYNDSTKTISLTKGWTANSPVELSILVHEMVHHLQNLGGLKYACAAEREKLAYKAQEKWLELFGYSLKETFEIDPATLLLSTQCLY